MENRDPALKLFGKTITVPPVAFKGEEEKDHKYSISESENKRNESPKTESITTSESKEEKEEHTTSKQQDKPLKKPDKILPCPRCDSMDTKFCYFNNYNVNQPRHFCKHCERYWTAGGSMRNVPVGAGRRKNKSSFLSRRLNTNGGGATLDFSSSKVFAEHQNGDEQSTGSTVTGSNSAEEGEQQTRNYGQNFPSQLPCFIGTPWPHPLSLYAPAGYKGWSIPCLPRLPPSETVHLGKHSRDDKSQERDVWMPKRLRIDDPEEAAKSSIWASMGFKSSKAFEPKTVVKTSTTMQVSEVLRANPAAFSRSLKFHESL